MIALVVFVLLTQLGLVIRWHPDLQDLTGVV